MFAPDLFIVDKEPTGFRGEIAADAGRREGPRLPLRARHPRRHGRAGAARARVGAQGRREALATLLRRHLGLRPEGALPAAGRARTSRRGGARASPTPAICAASCRDDRTLTRYPKLTRGPFILVTTGGGGDGDDLIDWVISAYETRARPPARAGRVRPLHRPRDRGAASWTASPARSSTRIMFDTKIELLMQQAAARRRDGRLQHVLRDPVARQAGADRAAHAPRLEQASAPPAPSGSASCAMLTGGRRRRARSGARWRAALSAPARTSRGRPRPSCRAFSTGSTRIERASPAAARGRAPGRPPSLVDVGAPNERRGDRRGRGRIAVVVKGYPRLSETFIAQEILGLEARRAPLEIWSLRHPTDKAVHPMHQAIRARRPLPAGISLPGAAARPARRRAALRQPRFGRARSRLLARPACATRRRTAAGASARRGPRARTRRRQSRICMCITCTRRPPWCATRRCSPAGPGASRRTPRTSGRRRAGKAREDRREPVGRDLHDARVAASPGARCLRPSA